MPPTLWYVIESDEWMDEPPIPEITHWHGCLGVLKWPADQHVTIRGGTVHSEHKSEWSALLELWANDPSVG